MCLKRPIIGIKANHRLVLIVINVWIRTNLIVRVKNKCLSSSKNIVQYLNLILFKYDLRRAIWRALSHYQKISSSNYTLLKRNQCQWMTLKVSGTHVDWCFCWSTSHPGTLTLKNLLSTLDAWHRSGKTGHCFLLEIGFSLLLRKDRVY